MKADVTFAGIIILALCWATYVTVAAASAPRVSSPPPCRTQWGEDRPQEYCAEWRKQEVETDE